MGLFDRLRGIHDEANAPGKEALEQLREERARNEPAAMAVKASVLQSGASPEGVVPSDVAERASDIAKDVRITGEIPVITSGQAPQSVEGQAPESSPVAVMDHPVEQPHDPSHN